MGLLVRKAVDERRVVTLEEILASEQIEGLAFTSTSGVS
jgi:hypothetical protein